MSYRPYIQPESIHIVEARCFGAAIQNFCDSAQGAGSDAAANVLQLLMVRPDRPGRREICTRQMQRPGGLIGLGAIDPPGSARKTVDEEDDDEDGPRRRSERLAALAVASYGYDRWHKVHTAAYAASRKPFEERGSGEQIYGAPGENSCMVLLDDVKTPEPVIAGVAGLSMETSTGNYQHLYACNRILAGAERRAIQLALVALSKSLGVGGDGNACGPFQPHRVPGSVNYKPGRGLFVCRLAETWLFHVDGARPLPADKWIRRGQELAIADPAKGVDSDRADAASTSPRLRREREIGGGDKSDSGADWAWTCRQVEQAAGKESGDALAQRLERELADRVRQRRGKDAERYARLTVFKVRREKNF